MEKFGLLILRVASGGGLAVHGADKLFGGIDSFIGFLNKLDFVYPEALAWAAILSEFVGGLMVLFGLYTRQAAFFCAFTMLMAIVTVHWGDPFDKWELAALYASAFVALIATGPGAWSLDARRGQ